VEGSIVRNYSLSHVGDQALLRQLASLVGQDRTTTAEILAHIAEVDARKLYLPAAYPSMYAYCVGELHLSEDAAYKRIQAARAARQFPAIFEAVAAGRLHLAAVVLLAPYLTQGNADELLNVAAHRTKPEIEQLLAERFPRSEMLPLVEAVPMSPGNGELAPGQVAMREAENVIASSCQLAPGQVESPAPRANMTPIAAQRFALHLTIDQRTHDMLRYAQELLSHQVPSGDVAAVLDRALEVLIRQLEKRKVAATTRPQATRRPTTSPRHIPAHVKRAVWERDDGQCTFVSESGKRCDSRMLLEFDHIDEVARGGRATLEGIRLRCRAHNQYGAECSFGAEFMRQKRQEARRAVMESRTRAAARAKPAAAAPDDTRAREAAAARVTPPVAAEQDVIPWLRQLGFRTQEARQAAKLCEAIPDASLEQRVRVALSHFHPRGASHDRASSSPGTSAP